ncbi:hypothetical protein GLOTRDRAFT_104173 [Gloeophyllum trabeum ATCC 11539]|uniref:Mini-chromosome maintenance complex-binding protein n=1 Tax=Gloeophyllum trabeum (strain ATCC 11539 / FP-39264 / Madison 617) TaxID=670483 RepID=S7QGE8_GLOTA|nr:uncharacterized protein GLOTRDRAFT_104173 [Gloeophyllum trabeum ATCC 11539]EPQ58258.1 hypothetical protein GLOTRDRAFT_104173 [Gloeophyllum trabeum ATCC 11539]
MDASAVSDALSDPSNSLLELYNSRNESEDFPAVVYEHFSNLFRAPDVFHTIPALSVKNPPEAHAEGALVRFRAMVQDTSQSPEMYMSRLADGRCGGWNLESTAEEEVLRQSEYASLRECTVIWATSVPGEADWVLDAMDGSAGATQRVHVPARPHKFPLPDALHVGAQVKIYHASGLDAKPTDLVDFVGILHIDVLHGEQEEVLSVPTLHVLFSRPVDRSMAFRDLPPPDNSADIRKQLISWIAEQALSGDLDAAEWVLLSCIAQIQARQTPLLPPSLTLSKLPPPPTPSSVPALCRVLSLLLPQVITLPATLDSLNQARFIPESMEEDLHSGYLQTPQGTTVVVVEVGLQEGKLRERGMANVVATQKAMSSQTISYVFPFSQFSFNTDMNFIIMTEGSKSAFFKTEVVMPVQPESTAGYYRNESAITKPASLPTFRYYLHKAKNRSVTVGEQISELIQSDFVESRRHNPAQSPEDLILRMKIAKLMAQSLDLKELDVETWRRSTTLHERSILRMSSQ